MTRNDGGYAFPVSTMDGFTENGMSLRDWFAGQALSITANEWFFGPSMQQQPQAAAEFAYEVADAMLEARASTRSMG